MAEQNISAVPRVLRTETFHIQEHEPYYFIGRKLPFDYEKSQRERVGTCYIHRTCNRLGHFTDSESS